MGLYRYYMQGIFLWKYWETPIPSLSGTPRGNFARRQIYDADADDEMKGGRRDLILFQLVFLHLPTMLVLRL